MKNSPNGKYYLMKKDYGIITKLITMKLKAKRINEDFSKRNYPELLAAVLTIPELSPLQKEMVLGLSIDIADKADADPRLLFDSNYEQPELFNEDYD